MKALSLWQPYASLIAVGAKRFETRGWATAYRGPLLICAAKRKPNREDLAFLMRFPDFRKAVTSPHAVSMGITSGQKGFLFPLGVAVCLADLTDCLSTNEFQPAPPESLFGNYAENRFAWKLENVRPIVEPVPVVGRQMLFDLDPEEQRAVERALGFVGVG